jgi:endonuclease G, mitochondrial
MSRAQVDAILKDPELAHEIAQREAEPARFGTKAIIGPPETRAIVLPRPLPNATGPQGPGQPPADFHDANTEAVIIAIGRPSLLIRGDSFEVPKSDIWRSRLYPTKSRLQAAIRSIGRVEVPALSIPFVGTGWMIAPGVMATNRHVASEFAQKSGARFTMRFTPDNRPFTADLDFHEEASKAVPFEVDVAAILYIADDAKDVPDIAFIRVSQTDARPLPPPLPLSDTPAQPNQYVVAIGYPARDDRNDAGVERKIFGSTFNVKRLAPGEVNHIIGNGIFGHDCSTLGGSSGSAIVDIETGAVLGMHYGGFYGESNYAIAASVLRDTLARVGGPAIVTTGQPTSGPAVPQERVVHKADMAGRTGYDPAFLGPDSRADLPVLGATLVADALVVDAAASGSARYALPYEHFSVIFNKTRRLAIATAVNIDGSGEIRLKRTSDPWTKDPRVPAAEQIGKELYVGSDFDRGHLVRRLDPCWGPTAKLAEADTFFYTNSTPQQKTFNENLWANLEDYLLDNAQTLGFKANVFTGPVASPGDPKFRGASIPTAYWKVAVMQRTEDQKLTATGYIVSQADLLTGLEFAFGEFKTYQVPIARIETLTGLNFGALKAADPLAGVEAAAAARELTSADDITV